MIIIGERINSSRKRIAEAITGRDAYFILSGKTTSFGRGQSELALPEGNKSIGGVME
jgi:hypothetical protein